jgi:hypothetical protein
MFVVSGLKSDFDDVFRRQMLEKLGRDGTWIGGAS